MLARNETIFKWALYAGATAVFFLLQGAVLQRITLWGVIPFVFPILVAVLGMYEGPLPASVYALTVGVLCDLLLPASIPCFYTLIFPAAGLCAALISQSLLPAGFLCGWSPPCSPSSSQTPFTVSCCGPGGKPPGLRGPRSSCGRSASPSCWWSRWCCCSLPCSAAPTWTTEKEAVYGP